MSYMGQDFIANHMKSHYRRILSAKAAVDTSPPKSMKMHVKVRDQKKRAALESRAGTPLSLRTRSPSMEFLSSSQNETTTMYSSRGQQSPGQRPSTGTPIQRSMSVQSLDKHYLPVAPSPSPRDMATSLESSLVSRPPVSPIASDPRQTLTRGHKLKHKKILRTLYSLDNSEQRTSNNLDHGNLSTLLGSYGESGDIKAPLTASYNGEERLKGPTDQDMLLNGVKHTSRSIRNNTVPRLDLTQVSYSHRSPPSIRTVDTSTDFKANIWEEEQKYLKFISDVTTDILARGIFSNRVLQQVFEIHIERRKDHLDEGRLKEMIEQLKEDLGITDS